MSLEEIFLSLTTDETPEAAEVVEVAEPTVEEGATDA
jgi:hypothetical protein